MQTDDNYLQKTALNHPFKNYRARDAFNRLSSLFEYNPFKNLKPKGRSLSTGSSNKINPFLKPSVENNDNPMPIGPVDLKPPSAIVTPRNRTYFENLIASSKHLPDDEHPIIIKNNHGKLRDFNRLKPSTLSDLNTLGMTSRTTVSLHETANYTTKKLNAFSSSKENGSSEEISFKSSTLPTVFDEDTDSFHSNNTSSNNYSAYNSSSSINIVKPIREWNNINHLAHLNNHLVHNAVNHLNHINHHSDSSSFSKTTSSPVVSHRLTTTTNSNRQTTALNSHRTPAHVIITKKGNYTTNNSSKYYATPSYNLEKKKPMRFSLKPLLISTNDQDRKQSSHSSVYNENDNPIKVNSYEDLDFSYSTTAMPMDIGYDASHNNQLNIKHPEHPQLIVHSNQHTKHPPFTKTKSNITISTANNQRNNTKLANISKWSTKLSPFKINQLLNNHTIKIPTQAPQVNQQQFSQQISSTTSSSEEDHSFTQLQSQHQANGPNKSPFNPFQNLATQRPILQVTQLSGVYTKPDSDMVHSGAITVMDGDSSEQQQQQQQHSSSSLPNTSTTIMHNNLVVTYKPGRPLPSSIINSSGEQQIISTTPSFLPQQHMNEHVSQDNILNNKNKRPSTQSNTNTKTNYTLSKLPKPPVKNKINQLNNLSSSSNKIHHVNKNHLHSSQQQQQVSTNAQPPRRVGLFGQQQTIQHDHQIHEQQHHHNHTISSSSIKNNSTSGHHTHRHSGYVNAIHAPPLPSYPFSTPSPQIVQRNPLLAWLGVDSLSQLLDRSFLFRTFVVILTILLLPPLTVVAAITSIG